ncbi:hypothetical protein K7X08_026741 [Anisodus acutangulus]|uniref:Uncharacterized protein n=1 Tax=Anisodus acutangulus TaxID=402998 RepID=A0A9Q1LB29_9SOLA|nr:hypothetical protein K7X08_026741 [Anisodus acutangulus]
MNDVSWKCLMSEGMHASNRQLVLTGEGFRLCQEENEDLKAKLDAHDKELQFLRNKIASREKQLAGDLPAMKTELVRMKNDYVRAMQDLEQARA